MPECRGCGADIGFVEIEKKDGTRKQHPIDLPRVKVPEGRVVFDDALGCYRILDARLKREKDRTVTVRAGAAWPVDGGAYQSHFDTCPDAAARRMAEKRQAKPRTEEEVIEWEIAEASSHIQRCRAPDCGLPMDEALSGDEAWRTHPSCDPQHRHADLAERNRLTGRLDIRAQDIVPSLSGQELAEIQHTVAKQLVQDRLRRAQSMVDIEWEQSALMRLSGDGEPDDGRPLGNLHLPPDAEESA